MTCPACHGIGERKRMTRERGQGRGDKGEGNKGERARERGQGRGGKGEGTRERGQG